MAICMCSIGSILNPLVGKFPEFTWKKWKMRKYQLHVYTCTWLIEVLIQSKWLTKGRIMESLNSEQSRSLILGLCGTKCSLLTLEHVWKDPPRFIRLSYFLCSATFYRCSVYNPFQFWHTWYNGDSSSPESLLSVTPLPRYLYWNVALPNILFKHWNFTPNVTTEITWLYIWIYEVTMGIIFTG